MSARLAQHIGAFVRSLRHAGLAIGPSASFQALEAVTALPDLNQSGFKASLKGVLIKQPSDNHIFDQAYALYFRNPQYLQRLIGISIPSFDQGAAGYEQKPVSPRLLGDTPDSQGARDKLQESEVAMALQANEDERIRKKDFSAMSAQEFEEIRRFIAVTRLKPLSCRTRRWQASGGQGRVDMKCSVRHAMRQAGRLDKLAYKSARNQTPNLVFLLDISGSMARYSEAMLHLIFAVSQIYECKVFALGTRLTSLSSCFKNKDPDHAMQQVFSAVCDWSGGTRLGETLNSFNQNWARRSLTARTRCFFVTDGLERGSSQMLEQEVKRLAGRCERLVWLNPLMRWDGYEPLAMGAKILNFYVNARRSVHSIQALQTVMVQELEQQ